MIKEMTTTKKSKKAISKHFSKPINNKKIGERYFYYNGDDCYIYETICANCLKKVGGWSEGEANEEWEKHFC